MISTESDFEFINPSSSVESIKINSTEKDERLEQRKVVFENYKENLPKEPTGDVKKQYCVGCFNKDDWEYIHEELKKDGSLDDNIPTVSCECTNDCLQSDVRGKYLLTDSEVTLLKNHSKVKYVVIDVGAYPGTYMDNPDNIKMSVPRPYRYASNVRNGRVPYIGSGTFIPDTPTSEYLNKASYQVLRHSQKRDPWLAIRDIPDTNYNHYTTINSRISQYGTGEGVDLIVCDDSCWFGHIEFQNPSMISSIKLSDNSTSTTTSGPTNYIGGNVLKSGFSTYSQTGSCDLLDLCLDAPYYIDPDWFDGNSSRRTNRWDGTVVPTETAAKEWWSDSTKRSASFSNIGTISSTDLDDYTRASCTGSNTAYNTNTNGDHGTQCASQAYGREYGWAYNANKWFLNQYGADGVGYEAGFDMQKIFHQNKPNRSKDNTKNPTLSSNSWGTRHSILTTGGYYFYRGATGVEFSSWDYDGNTDGDTGVAPRFITNFSDEAISYYPVDNNSIVGAGNELIESGVIFVCAAGNARQKQTIGGHADFSNYVTSTTGAYLFTAGEITYSTLVNRPGFPAAIGNSAYGSNTGSDSTTVYNTIIVGALQDEHGQYGSDYKERKVEYSNMGNAIDVYAAAHLTFAAGNDQVTGYNRYDAYYSINSTQSVESEDTVFSGTSSACPVAAGLIATKLEHNRDWTTQDVKNWINGEVGEQSEDDFHRGTEVTTANSTDWSSDDHNLHGGSPKIIWDALTGSEARFRIKGPLNISGSSLNITT